MNKLKQIPSSIKSWFVYILKCKNNSLYTGITTNLTRRIKEHNSGSGSHYTKVFRPVKLIWNETHSSHSSALKREAQIKKWTRKKKLALIAGDFKPLKKL